MVYRSRDLNQKISERSLDLETLRSKVIPISQVRSQDLNNLRKNKRGIPGSHPEVIVPPVEGVAGGGTAYGWGEIGTQDPYLLRGSIDPRKVNSSELVHVWCMPSSANVGPQDMPRTLEPISLLAARNERESVQIAIRPKVSWAGSSIAGTMQMQCTDLCSTSGDRLVVGESLKVRRVVPILGVPDALVPLEVPLSQLTLFPGSTAQCLGKAERIQLYQELRSCLDVMEPFDGKPLDEVVERVNSASSSLRRVLLSPLFSDFCLDNGSVDMMDEDAISNLSIRVKISLTVWDFILPATPSVPAVIGISDTVIEDRFGVEHGSSKWYEALDQHFQWLLQYKISPFFCRWRENMRVLTYTCPWPADHPKSDEYFSDPRLAAYAVPYSPVVSCGDTSKDFLQREVEILRTKSHWRKAYFYLWDEVRTGDDKLSAQLGLAASIVACSFSGMISVPLNLEHYEAIRNMASEIHAYAPDARIMTTYYCGPSDAPLASNNFEAFLKVPEFLRPHTQIYCTSEWVIGKSVKIWRRISLQKYSLKMVRGMDVRKIVLVEFQTSFDHKRKTSCRDRIILKENGQPNNCPLLFRDRRLGSTMCTSVQQTTACYRKKEWWTYVCMGPSDPHPNWHLGMRGTQHRAVMWRVWKEGGTGFLYWGANCYEKATVPSAEIKFRRGLPPGDGVLYYPGQVFSSSQEPVASLRLERLLSGLQDIEYLKLYSSRFGREEGLHLLEKTGMYLGPERYTHEHVPIDVMRGEVYRTCQS
ncbi:hypothetical protein DH2020_035065 [Rehmannia glutinosa]|uniref:Glycoside hydrolase 123 catalytic domain-containing protein n=1 Tax=Rehmannia glutinosa TaxID=99300 RepID=A0ABR0VAG4_REHGL